MSARTMASSAVAAKTPMTETRNGVTHTPPFLQTRRYGIALVAAILAERAMLMAG